MLFIYFLKIYLFIQGGELEKEREPFHPLVHPPDGCNGQNWGSRKPGAASGSLMCAQGPHCLLRP